MRCLSKLLGPVAGLVLCACAGKGAVNWDRQVKPVTEATCVHCHDPQKLDERIASICAATFDDADPAFAAAGFIDEYVVKAADPAAADALFAELCPDPAAPRSTAKDRLLYGFKNLQDLMKQPPGPDYTSAAAFEAFSTASTDNGSYEGCEVLELMEKGDAGQADGMPPLWSERLMQVIGQQYTPATAEDRAVISKYTEQLLPYGRGSCTGGTGGS